jgi:hypothetical protein
MTAEEVQELFIQAAEIDRRLPISAGPSKAKSMSLPYVHDWADINGWDSEDKKAREWAWLDPDQQKIRPDQVTLWERANTLVGLVENDSQRRCLLNWAIAKAGGVPFSVWCRKDERIHEETGRRRKDRAIFSILKKNISVNGNSTHVSTFESLLPTAAEIGDICVNIEEPRTSWASPENLTFGCDFDTDLGNFDWAETQNKRRRQREEKRRKAAA